MKRSNAGSWLGARRSTEMRRCARRLSSPERLFALLKASSELSVGLVWKRVLIGSAELRRACIEAQSTDDCVGIAIDDTPIAESFKREFRWNRAHGRLAQGVAR